MDSRLGNPLAFCHQVEFDKNVTITFDILNMKLKIKKEKEENN